MITEYTAATLVLPGCTAHVDGLSNIVIEIGEVEQRMKTTSGLIRWELSIFQSAVHSIAEETGAALRRGPRCRRISKERRSDYYW